MPWSSSTERQEEQRWSVLCPKAAVLEAWVGRLLELKEGIEGSTEVPQREPLLLSLDSPLSSASAF